MGPGRWGTADPMNGVPVKWSEISGSQIIVETDIAGTAVPPSQGAHFFQNVMSFGIGFMTVHPDSAESDDAVDYNWLASFEPESHSSEFVKHIKFDEPLEIVIDGLSNSGVVMKPGKSFGVYVTQMDAYMSDASNPHGTY
eukprot:GFYU01007430.1.p2 GENE.GFYU01007430.1~~GFYU01007430.1.p2  ORF type:complete len:140 (+),score=29.53 GFYU01007430.1:660-1079(+)